ncbi:DEAD/DEAH box helicase [Streptomyces sp. WZ-12]|uniref:DEAD/DEAH box helicase n=1 Tax=Streptomyces sp. WZ-12 TaxID=3030210 RepID=UPI0023811A71|nr:DEAD/DEAH box helicase [Streptomyces sp. WZ-12]
MFVGKLHPYQEQDVGHITQRGAVLCAYTMGLGKTVLSLAVTEEWLAQDDVSTCMIVVPASLKWQWAQSIAEFTDVPTVQRRVGRATMTVPDSTVCAVIDGSKAQKAKQYEAVLAQRPEYIVLGYEQVIHDWPQVLRIKPDAVVLDEASFIKSFRAQRTKKLKRLTARYRLALSGTVIDNGQPEELFSLFEWVDPVLLGRWDLFDASFIERSRAGFPIAYKNLPLLHQKLSTAMIRRTYRDADVAPYMPKVRESVLPVQLTIGTRRAYEHIAQDVLTELDKVGGGTGSLDLAALYAGRAGTGSSAQGRVMARLSALQMLLNYPFLLEASAADYASGDGGSEYAATLMKEGVLDGVDGSPKVDAVVRYLQKELLKDPELKVVAFAFHKGVLPVLADRLAAWPSVCFTGDMSAKAKAEAKVLFQTDPRVRLFLASDAGGYGVDLPQARVLVNVDQRDSSGAMDQRNTRHVRASSHFPEVEVVNVVVQGTIEERRLERLEIKRRTVDAILDGRGADRDGRVVNDVESLRQHLERTLGSVA